MVKLIIDGTVWGGYPSFEDAEKMVDRLGLKNDKPWYWLILDPGDHCIAYSKDSDGEWISKYYENPAENYSSILCNRKWRFAVQPRDGSNLFVTESYLTYDEASRLFKDNLFEAIGFTKK